MNKTKLNKILLILSIVIGLGFIISGAVGAIWCSWAPILIVGAIPFVVMISLNIATLKGKLFVSNKNI